MGGVVGSSSTGCLRVKQYEQQIMMQTSSCQPDKTFCTLVRLGLSHSGLETSWQPVVEKGKIRFSQQVGERLLGSTGSCKIKLVGYTVQHRQPSCDCFGQITAATCLQPTANYSLSSDANRKRTCSPSKQKLCLLCWFRC